MEFKFGFYDGEKDNGDGSLLELSKLYDLKMY